MKKVITITHMTSVHTRYDTRIFIKECCSLATIDNYLVNLIVADGKGDEINHGVHIFDVGQLNGRLNRVVRTTRRVLRKALELNSDIYHFHDPELIPAGLRLTRSGKKVIFDAHENIAEQIKGKSYIPSPIRTLISKTYKIYEKARVQKFTLILAEDSYAEYFSHITKKYTIVLNMPQTHFFDEYIVGDRKEREFFYIGSITENRGVYLLLDALRILHDKGTSFKMHFVGQNDETDMDMEKYSDIKNDIIFHGRKELNDGFQISKSCMIGVSILKPIGNYVTSYSTKIFEYMAVKLPVITSNFPLYQDVVEKYNCGICVNPLDPKEIATAMQYIIDQPEIARQMGENGKKAIDEKFNWDVEQKKLFGVYNALMLTDGRVEPPPQKKTYKHYQKR